MYESLRAQRRGVWRRRTTTKWQDGGKRQKLRRRGRKRKKHTAVSAGQFLGSGGIGKDSGAGARQTFVAVTRGSTAPETEVHSGGNSYVAAVKQQRVSILMSALNWAWDGRVAGGVFARGARATTPVVQRFPRQYVRRRWRRGGARARVGRSDGGWRAEAERQTQATDKKRGKGEQRKRRDTQTGGRPYSTKKKKENARARATASTRRHAEATQYRAKCRPWTTA